MKCLRCSERVEHSSGVYESNRWECGKCGLVWLYDGMKSGPSRGTLTHYSKSIGGSWVGVPRGYLLVLGEKEEA
jgi:transcription initiation factor TFIIIB Brf1 subunit/transcription initiation factor TFIIB